MDSRASFPFPWCRRTSVSETQTGRSLLATGATLFTYAPAARRSAIWMEARSRRAARVSARFLKPWRRPAAAEPGEGPFEQRRGRTAAPFVSTHCLTILTRRAPAQPQHQRAGRRSRRRPSPTKLRAGTFGFSPGGWASEKRAALPRTRGGRGVFIAVCAAPRGSGGLSKDAGDVLSNQALILCPH